MITILKNITPKNLKNQKGASASLSSQRGEYAPKFNSVIHYIIEFISTNFLQPAKQIVNYLAPPLSGSRPLTGLSIVNCQLSIDNCLKIAAIAIILLATNSNMASAQTVAAERVSIIFVKLSIT